MKNRLCLNITINEEDLAKNKNNLRIEMCLAATPTTRIVETTQYNQIRYFRYYKISIQKVHFCL